ncbi:hypothetical protein [Streptomyces phaeochromogenes]|uniref:hypothetical protein n=1 Tax=Streptomyces phaeochromogenes TaxID=1923 RepID=UPI002DD99471|nr:hypothetical protein [Streptomyces phaeochromogenes]WRZ32242.1 hypothetical protein OG931_33190 [Streptomyces phaeochromogenes]
MGDTFGDRYWTRPTNSTRGRSQGEIRERAYNDQDSNSGCSLFLLFVLAAAALLGVVLG